MEFTLDDTIAALASAPGPAARGVIRISGPAAKVVLCARFSPFDADRWHTMRGAWTHRGTWSLAGLSLPLPLDVLLWPSRKSYTGESMAELHTFGSPPLLDALLRDLHACGARPARAGEFTLRAFLAGRIDLTQAEAVLGVIDAEGPAELRRALEQLAGGLAGRIGDVRRDLLDLLAELEAGLDFAEEGIEFVSRSEIMQRIADAARAIGALRTETGAGLRSSARRRVVLAGPPNAGKSTLFNALAARPLALVSPHAGTTRDYLRAELDWNGVAVELIDTPGEEPGTEAVLREAHVLREAQLASADLIVWCAARDRAPITAEAAPPALKANGRLFVETKADLGGGDAREGYLAVSAVTGDGLAVLKRSIAERLATSSAADAPVLGMTAVRCQESLAGAIGALSRAAAAATDCAGEELIASDLHEALDELGRVTGAVYTDDILDRIFSKFCIGK